MKSRGLPQPVLIALIVRRLPARRRRRVLHADPAPARQGGRSRHPDRGHQQRDRRRPRAHARGEEGRPDPRGRPLPADEGHARPGRHGRDPARAEPGRRGQRDHVRADHAVLHRDADLRLPRDPDHGRVPGQLLRPVGLPLPAAESRRRAARHARRDRPPLRDRRGRLRRGASASRLPADPCAPGDRRVRLRHGHRSDRRASDGRDRRHRGDRRDWATPATPPTTPTDASASAAPAGT